MTSNIKLLSFDGNRYDGLPKRFTRKNPRMVSIRGFFRRNGKEANSITASLTTFGKWNRFVKLSVVYDKTEKYAVFYLSIL